MIRVRDLCVTLGGRRILAGVDLHVAHGEALALVGPNGAGKTTVLRCLLGLVPYQGEICVADCDVVREPIKAKSKIGYMPQVPAFCEETARDALRFVTSLRGARSSEADSLLEQVGLTDHARRPVATFSTGMKQRLSLAAALIGEPPLLVLDEPTASLDLKGQTELVALLARLASRGRTIVLSSHRSEEVRALADRVVMLDEGRIVANGAVDRIAASAWSSDAGSPPADLLEVLR
ncbi:MAG: ABC transporter ATP-binding protein [Planctomycetota bacterium]